MEEGQRRRIKPFRLDLWRGRRGWRWTLINQIVVRALAKGWTDHPKKDVVIELARTYLRTVFGDRFNEADLEVKELTEIPGRERFERST